MDAILASIFLGIEHMFGNLYIYDYNNVKRKKSLDVIPEAINNIIILLKIEI